MQFFFLFFNREHTVHNIVCDLFTKSTPIVSEIIHVLIKRKKKIIIISNNKLRACLYTGQLCHTCSRNDLRFELGYNNNRNDGKYNNIVRVISCRMWTRIDILYIVIIGILVTKIRSRYNAVLFQNFRK